MPCGLWTWFLHQLQPHKALLGFLPPDGQDERVKDHFGGHAYVYDQIAILGSSPISVLTIDQERNQSRAAQEGVLRII